MNEIESCRTLWPSAALINKMQTGLCSKSAVTRGLNLSAEPESAPTAGSGTSPSYRSPEDVLLFSETWGEIWPVVSPTEENITGRVRPLASSEVWHALQMQTGHNVAIDDDCRWVFSRKMDFNWVLAVEWWGGSGEKNPRKEMERGNAEREWRNAS